MKWTVGIKIAAGFLITILALIVVGALVFQNTKQLIFSFDQRRNSLLVLRNIDQVTSTLKDAETGQRGYIITGEERYLEPYDRALANLVSRMKVLQNSLSGRTAQLERLAQVERGTQAKIAELKETIELRKTKGFEEAQRIVLTDRGMRVMDDLRTTINDMMAEEENRAVKYAKEVTSLTANTFAAIEWGIPIAALLTFLAGYGLTRSIGVPLRKITGVADSIARGDLGEEVTATTRGDEVGTLQNAFARMTQSLRSTAGVARQIATGNLTAEISPQSDKDLLGNAFVTMTTNLRALMRETLEGVNVLASSATEITSSTSQLAAGAAETAAAVTQTTATVEEVKQTSQVSSEKGKLVAESSQKTARVAQAGKRAVEETVEGMNRIRIQMESIAESIVRLSEQGQAIGKIIAVVDDIAAQSNLLAVNASIEAAKAGEHGKGFAVVAQEVKNLADQSKQATAQVRTILTEIQKATSGAVMATEQGTKAVEAGLIQSESAGEAIGTLSESISTAAQVATQIAATSQEQFVGMDQVALAMESIRTASTQTVTSTKQVETSAQNLHDLGQKLKQIVERFKVS